MLKRVMYDVVERKCNTGEVLKDIESVLESDTVLFLCF